MASPAWSEAPRHLRGTGGTAATGLRGQDAPSAARARAAASVVDVLVYVVVLNLFVEHAPRVVSETFTASLLTAVLLKLVLEVVLIAKDGAKARLRSAATRRGRAVGALLLWLVLVGSKLLVLETVDLVLGDRVSLGGFVPVTLLVLVLLLSRAAVRRLLGGALPPARDEHR